MSADEKIKYVVYARVSTAHIEQEGSFEMQKNDLQKYVSSQSQFKNFEYVRSYGDVMSGRKESRPEFQKMLRDAKAGLFSAIVTKSISRFARNIRFLLNALQELNDAGVRVIFVEDHIDSSDPSHFLSLTLLGTLADMESKNTSSHLRATYAVRRSMNKLARPCACCFGYKYDKETDTINIVDSEAQTVKNIFHWFVNENLSTGKIAARLTDSGIKTSYGKTIWSRPQIRKILACEKYVGIAKETDTATGKVFTFENAYPVLIDKVLFQKAQEIIDSRKVKDYKRRKASLYSLSGLVFCAKCGSRCNRYTKIKRKTTPLCDTCNGHPYWGCRSFNYPSSSQKCVGVYTVSEEYINRAIIEALVSVACGNKIAVDEGLLSNSDFSAFIDAVEQSNKNYEVEWSAFEARKKDLERSRKKELDLFRLGVISEADMLSNVHLIDKRLRELVPPKTPESKMMSQEHLKKFLDVVTSPDGDFLTRQKRCREHLYNLFLDSDFRRSITLAFVEKIYIGAEPRFTVSVELKDGLFFGSYHFLHRGPVCRGGKVFYDLAGM